MDEKIIIFGSNGMLGRDIVSCFSEKGYDLAAYDLPTIDIVDIDACREIFEHYKPTLVINAAAYTDVDGAEKEKALANQINAEATGNLAILSKKYGAKLVHYSTDYVFDGTKKGSYKEDDPVKPLSVYGKSKLLGEEAVIKNCDEYLIIRTAWLYGKFGKNFVKSIINASYQKPELNVVDDQHGAPTFTEDLADATYRLIEKGASGIVHFTNSGSTTWFDFTGIILDELNISTVKVKPITTKKLKRPAKRPANSVLDLSKYIKITGHIPRDFHDALKDFLKSFLLS